MEIFSGNVTISDLYKNENKAGYTETNAQFLLDVLKNISSVLKDIQTENSKHRISIPIPSIDARLRQENCN